MKHTRARKSANCDLGRIAKLLEKIDPDLHYGDWVKVLMAIYNETNGSEDGFELADAWSSRGQKYRGSRDIRSTWNSLRIVQDKPITIGTLIWMARQA
jgi:hypothetical protein